MDKNLHPPMGWNSWYCFSEAVSDEKIRKVAAAMVSKGLTAHGWNYINIDDCWQGERGGKYGAIQGNERFPDMKALGDYIHSLGLKFGLYSTPWIGSYAGFRGGSTDEGFETRFFLPETERLQPNQVFGRCPSGNGRVWRKGAEWKLDVDAKQWAEWGVDYVKVDWYPNDIPTTRRIRHDLDACGRNMVLSLSNSAHGVNAKELMEYANVVRISGDIRDNWESLKTIAFEHDPVWHLHTRSGHWADPDMLQIGAIGIPNRLNQTFQKSRLTLDEQRLQYSLWCMLSAPLLLSCDIEGMEDDTFSILTNDDVIAVDQESPISPVKITAEDESLRIYQRKMSDGSTVTALFNLGDEIYPYEFPLHAPAKELWSQETYSGNSVRITLASHSVAMLKEEKSIE